MAVADLLKRYMARSNLSDVQLAKRIGDVTRETVYRWRTGTIKAPKYNKAIKCAEVLELNLQERSDFFIAAGWPDPQAQVFAPQASAEENTDPTVGLTTRPISTTRDFFGRRDVIKRMAIAWNNRDSLEHIAIVGPKNSGKSSLLNYILKSHELSAQLHKQDDSDWPTKVKKFVYVDLGSRLIRDPKDFFDHVLEELRLQKPEPCDLRIFIRTVSQQVTEPTLFLLDNLDKGLKASEMDQDFWDGIRALSLGANGKLGFCITSEDSPQELENHYTSPFFNMFDRCDLKAFTKEEANDFIKAAEKFFSKRKNELSETDTKWLLEQSQQWPILLQELCKIRLYSNEDWKKVGKIKIQEYEYLWKKT